MSLSIKTSESAHSSMGLHAIASANSKMAGVVLGMQVQQSQHGPVALDKADLRTPESVEAPASLQLESRELSSGSFMKSEPSRKTSSDDALPTQPTGAPWAWAQLPRVDRTVSWADVDDSDSEEEATTATFSSTAHAWIASFSGDADQLDSGSTVHGSSAEDSPAPVAPAAMPTTLSASPDSCFEPAQTHFGFNLLPLGAVPEDAELSTAAVDDVTDPNNRVSVVISGGDECHEEHGAKSVTTRQHGYAGVLSMLHRSVSAEPGDLASSSGLAVTSARIEAVLPVGQDERVKQMVRRAGHGFRAQQEPSVPREGMGGTYFLADENGDKVGIFKPCDEEPLAPNNPKGWAGRAMGAPGMKPSVRVGEAALREVAAYLLDHDGFAGVPPAVLVLCRHPLLNYKVSMPKIESLMDISAMVRHTSVPVCSSEAGSMPASMQAGAADMQGPGAGVNAGGLTRALSRCALSDPAPVMAAAASVADQEEWSSHLAGPALPGGYKLGSFQAFASHIADANEIAPSHFSADNVHRIGILDIRLLNCDRHAGNLLVAERGAPTASATGDGAAPASAAALPSGALQRLVPIDHGYALPEALEEPYFEWQYWPQANVPFSAEVQDYVAALDVEGDIAALRQQLPALRVECLRCLEVSTLVLKECTAAGLSLFEIACVFSRPSEHVPSDFEVMCIDARTDALASATPHPHADSASSARPLISSSGGASPASPGSSLEMSGLLPGADECAVLAGSSSPRDIEQQAPRSSSSGSTAEASPPSPCLAAAGGSAPRQIVSSWLRTSALPPASGGGAASPPPLFRSPLAPSGLGGPAAQSDLLPAVFATGSTRPDVPPPPGSMLNMVCAGGLGGHSRRRRRRSAWASKRGMHGAGASLVRGVHPQKAKYVFTGISDTQWPVFVERMGEYVADELCKGTWRVGRQTGAVAGSCPEPSKQNCF
eukprot:jgi/Ulvmu1/9500/UM052_0071.1